MGVLQREGIMQAVEEFGEVTGRKHRRCSSTQIEGGDIGKTMVSACTSGLFDDRLDKGLLIGASWSVLIEGAIRADPVAEGDVNVDNQWTKF